MANDSRTSEVEVIVPVGSGEEDLLLDETLNAFTQKMAEGPDAEAAFLIVRSEYSAAGLVKKVIFETPGPAARFGDMWRAAQMRLAH